MALDLRYDAPGGLRLSMDLVSSGKRYDNNYAAFPAERVALGAYTLLGLSASQQLAEHFEIFARLENALDSEYEDVYGYGTPGAAAYGGLRYSF